MNAEEIKTLVMCYWRFARGCTYVACEFNYGSADVISATPRGQNIYDTEVKVSIADMKKELSKIKHRFAQKGLWGQDKYHLWANYFYFAVPETMQNKALAIIQNYFPYAGLLVVKDYQQYLESNERPYINPPIAEVKRPQRFQTFASANPETLARLAKGMSNSLCSKAYELMRLKVYTPSPTIKI